MNVTIKLLYISEKISIHQIDIIILIFSLNYKKKYISFINILNPYYLHMQKNKNIHNFDIHQENTIYVLFLSH